MAAGSIINGGCGAWTFATNTVLPGRSLSELPFAISLTTYNIHEMLHKVVSCNEEASTALIIGGLLMSSTSNTSCLGQNGTHTWHTKVCASGVPSLCVDCTDPCATNQCGNLNILNPCGTSKGSEYGCKALNSSINGYRILSVTFIPISLPPIIRNIIIIPSKRSINIRVLLNTSTPFSDGTVYCGSFPTGTKPNSITDITLQGFYNSSVNGIANLIISGLIPISSIDVYCYTRSILGTQMTLMESLKYMKSVVTLPFRELSVKINILTIYKMASDINTIEINLESSPSESILISVSTISNNSSNVIPTIPNNYFISSSDTTSYFFSLSSSSTALLGDMKVIVSASGLSANDYEISYAKNNQNIIVLGTNVLPPAPKLSSVVFSSDGTSLIATFDRDTNRGGITTYNFQCSYLFTFYESSQSKCIWINSNMIQINLGTGAIVLPGDVISFLGSSNNNNSNNKTYGIQGIRLNTQLDHAQYPFSPSVSLKIQAPLSPLKPNIGISAPTSIGPNDFYILDLTTTSGGGGRPFKETIFTVISSINNTRPQYYFDHNYVLYPPSSMPLGTFSEGSYNNIQITICNFLNQCNTAQTSVTVTSFDLPTVVILGNSLLYLTTERGLNLNANAYVGNQSSSLGLTYSWTIYKDNIQDFTIEEISKQEYSYKLSPYTLSLNSFYTVKLVVLNTRTGRGSTSSVSVLIVPSYIEGIIDGANFHSLSFGQNLTLDASKSYDNDKFGKLLHTLVYCILLPYIVLYYVILYYYILYYIILYNVILKFFIMTSLIILKVIASVG